MTGPHGIKEGEDWTGKLTSAGEVRSGFKGEVIFTVARDRYGWYTKHVRTVGKGEEAVGEMFSIPASIKPIAKLKAR